MTDNELSIKLREDARKIGLCDQWYGEWKDETNQQELIDKYKRGLDFCIKHRWPSKSFIKEHFSQNFLRNNGILVDDTRSYPARHCKNGYIYIREYVLIGNSQTTLRYAFRPHLCNVWACDSSTVIADVKYGAYILIHLFDNARAKITTDLVSKVTVIRHSPDTKVVKDGQVTVKDEFYYLE